MNDNKRKLTTQEKRDLCNWWDLVVTNHFYWGSVTMAANDQFNRLRLRIPERVCHVTVYNNFTVRGSHFKLGVLNGV